MPRLFTPGTEYCAVPGDFGEKGEGVDDVHSWAGDAGKTFVAGIDLGCFGGGGSGKATAVDDLHD